MWGRDLSCHSALARNIASPDRQPPGSVPGTLRRSWAIQGQKSECIALCFRARHRRFPFPIPAALAFGHRQSHCLPHHVASRCLGGTGPSSGSVRSKGRRVLLLAIYEPKLTCSVSQGRVARESRLSRNQGNKRWRSASDNVNEACNEAGNEAGNEAWAGTRAAGREDPQKANLLNFGWFRHSAVTTGDKWGERVLLRLTVDRAHSKVS